MDEVDPRTNLPVGVIKVLKDWSAQIIQQKQRHSKLGLRYATLYYLVGIPLTTIATVNVLISAVNLTQCAELICIFQFILGLFAAVLSGLQTFLDLQTKSVNHKTTFSRLGGLERTIESILNMKNKSDSADILHNVKSAYDFILDDAPLISIKEYHGAIKKHTRPVHTPNPQSVELKEKSIDINDLEFKYQLDRFSQNV